MLNFTAHRIYLPSVTLSLLMDENDMPWLKLLEPPWRNNQSQLSCIPEGVYQCSPYLSPSKGDVYLLNDTGSRKYIELHIANKASELLGCLAPGLDFGKLDGQIAVSNSEKALTMIKNKTNYQPFQLTITSKGQ